MAFNNIYKNKKVLVTGDTGFKGSWLCSWLLELGANVHGLAKDIPTTPSMFEAIALANKITHQEILNKQKMLSTQSSPTSFFIWQHKP